jgi:hypothetical protein
MEVDLINLQNSKLDTAKQLRENKAKINEIAHKTAILHSYQMAIMKKYMGIGFGIGAVIGSIGCAVAMRTNNKVFDILISRLAELLARGFVTIPVAIPCQSYLLHFVEVLNIFYLDF